MNCYYIMIHFNGPFVSGFVIPQAESEADALRQLKRIIATRIQYCNEHGIEQNISFGDGNVPRLKQYMRSLKRPWREAGEYRGKNPSKKATARGTRGHVVDIRKLVMPVTSGYWLADTLTSVHICNLPTEDSDGSIKESVAAG